MIRVLYTFTKGIYGYGMVKIQQKTYHLDHQYHNNDNHQLLSFFIDHCLYRSIIPLPWAIAGL